MAKQTAVARGTIYDSTPRICWRTDDGSDALLPDIRKLVHKWRIPVSISLNWSFLRTGGKTPALPEANTKMTRAALRQIFNECLAAGLPLQINMHGNTNWTGYASMSWQDVLDEVDPSAIEDFLGCKVRVYVQPGDAGVQPWCQYNRQRIIEALQYHGIEYAVGLNGPPAGAATWYNFENGHGHPMLNSDTELVINPAQSGNGFQNVSGMFRPGCLDDPYMIPDGWTADLGSSVVSRGTPAAGGGAPGPDPVTGASGWLLGEDNHGDGAEGSAVADHRYDLAVKIYRALGMGLDYAIATHGERRTNALTSLNLTDALPAGPIADHFSVDHIGGIIAKLRDAGQCDTVNLYEFCGRLLSDYADGIDLIDNPRLEIPQRIIGDVVAGKPEVYCPRGIATQKLHGWTGYAVGNFPINGMTLDADNHVVDGAAICGPDVVGYQDKPGGLVMCYGDSGKAQALYLSWGWLPSGRYELSWQASHYSTGMLTLDHIGCMGTRTYRRPYANRDPQDLTSLALFHVRQTQEVYKQQSLPADGYMSQTFGFLCPSEAEPMLTAKATADPGSVAAGASASVDVDISTHGLRLLEVGGRARLLGSNIELPVGVSASAVVTQVTSAGVATVTVTFQNDTASAWAPGSGIWYVGAIVSLESLLALDYAPSGPWVWNIGLVVSKDTSTALTLDGLRLRKFRT